MKNDNHVWDNKHPTAQMLGRWQPWHAGHQRLFEETLKKSRENNSNNNREIKNNINENEMKDELKNFFKELNTEKEINLGSYNTNYSPSIF